MKIVKLLGVALLLLVALIGCQRDSNPVEPTAPRPGLQPSLEKVTLPAGATVTSAILTVYQTNGTSGETVSLHRAMADWTEGMVTWANFAEQYESSPVATFTAGYQWHSIDVTALVQDWVNGTSPVYGVVMRQPTGYRSIYASSEYGTVECRPKLEITYDDNGVTTTVVIQRGTNGDVMDAYIWESTPGTNNGSYNELYAGMVNDLEKISLIKFDLTVEEESDGCTRTPGYWKNHTQRDPKRYDDTWKAIGSLEENEPFFISGLSYYDVLSAPSAGGNVYFTLGQAYIAAELNQAAGASIPASVLTAFGNATTLFLGYTPATVGAMKGSNPVRQQFVSLAKILDDYNNGLTGPGHCEDDVPAVLQVNSSVR